MLSIPAAFALTVVCCERSPKASCELIVTSTAELSSNSFANLRLESCFLDAKRIVSGWQTGETVFAGRVGKAAPFQSSALADNRHADAWDNGATWVGDGAGNSRKLGLRRCTGCKERCQGY